MIRVVVALSNALLGFLKLRSGRVCVGKGSKVRWRGVHAHRKGQLHIGTESIVHARIDFDGTQGHVVIGNRCFLGASHLVCHSDIRIGDDVLVSWGVTIVDHNSHSIEWANRSHDVSNWLHGRKDWSTVKIGPIRIEDRAWIGFGATVLCGVTIGRGAVVGAHAVVTKDVPPYCVVAGNPARIIRRLNEATGAIGD